MVNKKHKHEPYTYLISGTSDGPPMETICRICDEHLEGGTPMMPNPDFVPTDDLLISIKIGPLSIKI